MTVDNAQRNYLMAGAGSGLFYLVSADGQLSIWKHLGWQDGSFNWANGGSPKHIGDGFQSYTQLLAGSDGSLYGFDGFGNANYYQYVITNTTTLDGNFINGGMPVKVGSGFDKFTRIFGGLDGVFWGADANGDLYRWTYSAGAMTAPVKVGSGWKDIDWCGADAGGVVYGVRFGVAVWYRYVNGAWVNNGNPIQIGDGGWGGMASRILCAAGNGLFYWTEVDVSNNPPADDTQLGWLYLTNYQTVNVDGTTKWANGGNGKVVGSGFTAERWSPLQGYCWPQSITPGSSTGVKVSSTLGTLTASIMQLAPGTAETKLADLPNLTGALQVLQSDYHEKGCGWSDTTTVTADPSWPSGVYAVRLTDTKGGASRDLPFVVKPASPAAPVAVLLPWLTYHAYNEWAGHGKYTGGPAGLWKIGMQRPSYKHETRPMGVRQVELYGDILLLRWLSRQGYQVDVYTDLDLHDNPGLLQSYKALILGSHPEYMSDAMRPAIARWVYHGGRLLYFGGNGMYERCAISDDLTQVTYFRANGDRDLFRDHGQPEADILGVNYVDVGWMTRAPYKKLVDHPFFDGTNLANGALFGTAGYNGAASGVELDIAPSGYPGTVIAVGQNDTSKGLGGGANMTVTEHPNGGFVFAAGSLTFASSLISDATLSQVADNVMRRAIS